MRGTILHRLSFSLLPLVSSFSFLFKTPAFSTVIVCCRRRGRRRHTPAKGRRTLTSFLKTTHASSSFPYLLISNEEVLFSSPVVEMRSLQVFFSTSVMTPSSSSSTCLATSKRGRRFLLPPPLSGEVARAARWLLLERRMAGRTLSELEKSLAMLRFFLRSPLTSSSQRSMATTPVHTPDHQQSFFSPFFFPSPPPIIEASSSSSCSTAFCFSLLFSTVLLPSGIQFVFRGTPTDRRRRSPRKRQTLAASPCSSSASSPSHDL